MPRLGLALRRLRREDAARLQSVEGRTADGNPFPGPVSYREDDEQRFFARRQEASDVTNLLQSSGLLLLYADSGVGKTSLLRAGVVWRLKEAGVRPLPLIRFGLDDSVTPKLDRYVREAAAIVDRELKNPQPSGSVSQAVRVTKEPICLIFDQLALIVHESEVR